MEDFRPLGFRFEKYLWHISMDTCHQVPSVCFCKGKHWRGSFKAQCVDQAKGQVYESKCTWEEPEAVVSYICYGHPSTASETKAVYDVRIKKAFLKKQKKPYSFSVVCLHLTFRSLSLLLYHVLYQKSLKW